MPTAPVPSYAARLPDAVVNEAAPLVTRTRLPSLDIVRGIVMVLMAVDHVRVYSGQPAGGPTAGIFFTRWITNFSAPGFVFFAGTGAYLYGRRVRDTATLARFLATRGLWLVLLELTVLRVAWTFNFDFSHYMLAGVLWMIGWCMVLMAGIVYLPVTATAASGPFATGSRLRWDPSRKFANTNNCVSGRVRSTSKPIGRKKAKHPRRAAERRRQAAAGGRFARRITSFSTKTPVRVLDGFGGGGALV